MLTTWKTTLIPQHKRSEFWRTAVCDAFLTMTPHIPSAQDFDASLDHLSLDSTSLNRIRAPAHGVSRTAHDIQRDNKQVFFLNMSTRGRCQVLQNGRAHTAATGELVLIDGSSQYKIHLPEDGELLSFSIPREWLINLYPNATNRTASFIKTSTISHLLCRQMIELTRISSVDLDQGREISTILVSMLSSSLAERLSSSPATSSRLRKLYKLISIHFADSNFGPIQAAKLAGISVRSLHLEFAQSASTFGSVLLNFRLEQARILLTQSDNPGLISQISKDCGFKSAEHFSRSFRSRFGRAPSLIAN
jgi:AraC family transcriptional activator of tynA and feaB